MPEAGFPPKPEKKEEETHKVEVEMNVEARKEVSVVEGKFLGNTLVRNSHIHLICMHSFFCVIHLMCNYLMVFICIALF